MMAGRCVICDGRIVDGRCQDCGMDYSRMAEHTYRLNEDCGRYSPEAREQKKEYERTLSGKEEKAAGTNGRKAGRQTGRSENRPTGGASGDFGKRRAERTSGGTENRPAGRPSGSKEERKAKGGAAGRRPVSVIKWFVILWVVLGFLSAVVTEFPDWFSGLGKKAEQAVDWLDENTGIEVEIGNDPEEDTGFETSENEARTTEDLYDYVKNEMPADGETWSASLTAGYYMVGETIPQGTYQVTVSEGKGGLYVEDEDNAIWYYSWLEPGNEVEDLRLYPGARVTVEGGCELEFQAENAQTEALTPYEADVSLEDVEVLAGEEYSVGTDIAPGRYDVRYAPDEDSGIVELRVEREDGDTRMIFLSGYGPEEGYRDVFYNLTLAEGETVTLEGAMEGESVYLSPELEFP